MTRSLYTKFLLGYLVFGLLGFIFIATMSSEITYQYLLEEKSESLYDEANLLASTYSDIYQGKYFIPGSRRNFNRILVKLSRNGCPDTTGILGKYHICSAESSCIDGTSVGVVPTGNLHHSRCCRI